MTSKQSDVEAIATFCYAKVRPVTEEERKSFFAALGMNHDNLVQEVSQTTPVRNMILARVKYEQLRQYLMARGRQDAAEIAMSAMYYSTQGPLRYIKYR